MSKNEEYILNILLKENIKFIREKTFSDLRKGKYRFDFYLPKYNICLEIDGEQHFKQISKFQKTRTDFLKQQENDRRKNSYGWANNMSLYRIPYWDLNKIKTFNDILNKKYLVKSKWHNDNLIIQ